MIQSNTVRNELPGNRKLILASKSPRRCDLLHQAGFALEIDAPRINEAMILNALLAKGEDYSEACRALALEKAAATYEKYKSNPVILVLAADTIVYLNGRMYGKPKDDTEALDMLKSLSGHCHQVTTAFAWITKDKTHSEIHTTEVRFNPWDAFQEKIAKRYVDLGLARDKAGAYGIQDFAGQLVSEIRGDYNTVVGLPLTALCRSFWTYLT